MVGSVDISDLTLKQLLHFYQDAVTAGNNQPFKQRSQSETKMTDQQDIKKFSEAMDNPSDTQPKVDQSLANIVDDLIKIIGE